MCTSENVYYLGGGIVLQSFTAKISVWRLVVTMPCLYFRFSQFINYKLNWHTKHRKWCVYHRHFYFLFQSTLQCDIRLSKKLLFHVDDLVTLMDLLLDSNKYDDLSPTYIKKTALSWTEVNVDKVIIVWFVGTLNSDLSFGTCIFNELSKTSTHN